MPNFTGFCSYCTIRYFVYIDEVITRFILFHNRHWKVFLFLFKKVCFNKISCHVIATRGVGNSLSKIIVCTSILIEVKKDFCAMKETVVEQLFPPADVRGFCTRVFHRAGLGWSPQ